MGTRYTIQSLFATSSMWDLPFMTVKFRCKSNLEPKRFSPEEFGGILERNTRSNIPQTILY